MQYVHVRWYLAHIGSVLKMKDDKILVFVV